MRRKPFWKGYGLWRVPNFFHSVHLDRPQIGLTTAGALHFRRLTIEHAARQLPAAPGNRPGDALPVYFMTGREHWAMTAFCAFSLLSASEANIAPVVLEDGSLETGARQELVRILPGVRFLDRQTCDDRVETVMPSARFPALRQMRDELPLMRKLIDLHAGSEGWKLFLDSDMLFFREPAWMLEWLRQPERPVYMRDYQNSYGYPAELIESVLGHAMPQMVNTGFCGLRSDAIDWYQLERWAAQLHAAGGTNHFSEQCLTAMSISTRYADAAPPSYLIWPSKEESIHPAALMHHYVAESRTWYHIYGWPGIAHRAAKC